MASVISLSASSGVVFFSCAPAAEWLPPPLFGEKLVYRLDEGGMGSEDFASYTYDLPCAYLLIGAGTKQENPAFGEPMHNERVVFNEDILPRGAALHTWCALNWLADEGNA